MSQLSPRPDGVDWNLVIQYLGVGGSLVGWAAVVAAVVSSAQFSWTQNAISDLGATTEAEPWLLNAGLLLGGLLVTPFGLWLWQRAERSIQQLGAVSFCLTGLSLAAIGGFPVGTPVHLPVSVNFYTLGTISLLLYGSGSVTASHVRRGLVSLWFVVIHLLSWLVWSAGLRVGPGLAIPELVGAVLFTGWIWMQSFTSPSR